MYKFDRSSQKTLFCNFFSGSEALLPAECSVNEVFQLAGKKSQHPKLVILLAGLNDLVLVYNKNAKCAPKTSDGQFILMDFVKRYVFPSSSRVSMTMLFQNVSRIPMLYSLSCAKLSLC